MTGCILLLQGEGQLVEMREQGYDREAVLQDLLAKVIRQMLDFAANAVVH